MHLSRLVALRTRLKKSSIVTAQLIGKQLYPNKFIHCVQCAVTLASYWCQKNIWLNLDEEHTLLESLCSLEYLNTQDTRSQVSIWQLENHLNSQVLLINLQQKWFTLAKGKIIQSRNTISSKVSSTINWREHLTYFIGSMYTNKNIPDLKSFLLIANTSHDQLGSSLSFLQLRAVNNSAHWMQVLCPPW